MNNGKQIHLQLLEVIYHTPEINLHQIPLVIIKLLQSTVFIEHPLILGVKILPPDLRGASLGEVATLTKAK